MANTGVNLLWEPDAKNRAKNRLLAALQNATSSEPGAQGPGTGYGGGVSPGGGTIADLAQQDIANVANQQLPSDYVAQTAQQAAAQGRKDPNISDLLKLAATFPELAVQEAVQAAISGFTLPGDVASGKQQLTDPTTGHITDQSLGRVLDLTGLAASGSVAGPAEAATGDLLGSGPVPKSPWTSKLYHGVTQDEPVGELRGPAYMAFDKDLAKTYAEDSDKGTVLERNTTLQNPLVLDTPEKVQKAWEDSKALDGPGNFYPDKQGALNKWAADKGHDGIVVHPDAFKGEKGYEWSAGTFGEPQVVVFDPKKAFQANAGSKEQAAVAEVAGQTPELYSHAARVVDSLPTAKAPAAQWLATLKNKGVKDEELEAIKLPADGTLTKDQLKAHIDANTPQLKDVVKGGDTGHPQYTQADVDRAEAEAQRTGNWAHFEEVQAEYEAQQLGRGTAATYDEDYQGNPTKYSQYQLPGGTNYREIVTTLPKKGELTEAERADYQGLSQRIGKMSPEDTDRYRGYLNRIGSVAADPNVYRSSHWDEPNVLAHTRVNDRYIDPPSWSDVQAIGTKMAKALKTDDAYLASGSPDAAVKVGAITPEEAAIWSHAKGMQNQWADAPGARGIKTLHAEELQSDWHQQGKKQGYKGDPKSKADLDQELKKLTDVQESGESLTPEQARRMDEIGYLMNKGETGGVPDAPFKKTWPDLLLKKLALRAHNEGYDAISWTDGATQAERYDLSRQVSSVGVTRNEDGTFNLRAAPIGADRNVQIGQSVAPERLPDLVGKDLADRIIGDNLKPGFVNKQYEGFDLKAGGEGMKAFYDQELPRRAKKILGAPVETKSLHTPDRDAVAMERYGKPYAELDLGLKRAIANELTSGPDVSVHFVRLTPEVRDRIKKGFPLFASGAPVPAQAQTDPTPRVGQAQTDPTPRVGQTRTMRLTRVPAIPQAGVPTIDRTHDVPAFAGSSNDNKTVYVDRHVPTQLNIDGKVIDPAKYLQIHEQFEHDLMANRKLPYDVAHKQATAAERAAVEADGVDWKSYEAHINGMLHAIETEPLKDEPADLYTKVYHTPEWGKRAAEIDRATHRRHIDTRIKE